MIEVELTVGADGFVVDASLIRATFRIGPAAVRGGMRAGEITSSCETGIGEVGGRLRLTFCCNGRALRLVVDAEDKVPSRATFATHPVRLHSGSCRRDTRTVQRRRRVPPSLTFDPRT